MPPTEPDLARLLRLNTEVFAFLGGLCLGSFLNVVIARLPEGLSVVRPASRCPKCLQPITWRDNIPLLSWLVLMGRCRHCRNPISARYPTVELLVGLLTLALERRFGVTPLGLAMLVFVAVLVVVAYIDLDHWIIPLELVIPAMAVGIVAATFFSRQLRWQDAVIGACAGWAAFQLIGEVGSVVFQRTALGAGDWWLIAMIGAFLGWQGLIPVILLASLQGSLIALALIGFGRRQTGEAPKPPEEEPEGATPDEAAPPEARSSPALEGLKAGLTCGLTAGVAAGMGISWLVGLLTGLGVGLAAGLAAARTAATVVEPPDEEWVPPRNSVPFGPFLALGALQQLFLADWLHDLYWHVMSRIVS